MVQRGVLAVLAVLVSPLAAGAGMQPVGTVTVPPPPGDYHFTALACDAGGGVYAFDGDTIYALQGGAFAPRVSGIQAAAWPGQEVTVDPSAFAVDAGGATAWFATGFSGRIVEVRIDPNLPAFGEAWELKGAALASNYGLAVDPVHGELFVTDSWTADLYHVTRAGAGSLDNRRTFPGAMYGGGIAFTPGDELIVPIATGFAAWPDDDGFPLDLYRFPRQFLDDLVAGRPTVTEPERYATGLTVSGTGFVAADGRGAAYLQGADAIYRVDRAGNLLVLCGDATQNAFDLVGLGFMGMAYDAAGQRLLMAHRAADDQPWRLYAYGLKAGDLNGDGLVDAGDRAPLVQALAAPAAYAAAHPAMIPLIHGDINDDLVFDEQDLDLDLADSHLVVDYRPGDAAPLATVAAWLRAGLNLPAGYWDGPRLRSSAAAADPDRLTALGVLDNADPWLGGRTTFAGEAVDASAVLLAYTYWGDADLDGRVTFDDYDVIDYYYWFPPAAGEAGWWSGDFDYDGDVDLDDYDRIDYAYWFQGGPLGGMAGAGQAPYGAVPEPGTLALLAAGGAVAGLRRGRRGGAGGAVRAAGVSPRLCSARARAFPR